MAPCPSNSRNLTMAGKKCVHIASIRKTPRDLARSTISRASAVLTAKGFSHNTALPESRHSSVF